VAAPLPRMGSANRDYTKDIFEIVDTFQRSMLILRKYFSEVDASSFRAHRDQLLALNEAIVAAKESTSVGRQIATLEVETLGGEGSKLGESSIYQLAICNEQVYDKTFELATRRHAALTVLNETCLQQVIVNLERLTSSIIYFGMLADPDNLKSAKPVNPASLSAFDNWDDAREYLAYEATRAISHDGFGTVAEFISKTLGAGFATKWRYFDDVLVAIDRRHAVVHATPFSEKYFRIERDKRNKRSKIWDAEGVASPSSDYVSFAWNSLAAYGSLVGYSVLMCCAEHSKSKDEARERAQNAFRLAHSFAFDLLQTESGVSAARNIFDEIRTFPFEQMGSPEDRPICMFNYAQACKWSGKEHESECNNVLDTLPLKSLASSFQLCAAGIRNDMDGFCGLLKKAFTDGDITVHALSTWPAFKLLRQREDFLERVTKTTGCDPNSLVRKKSAPLLTLPGSTQGATYTYQELFQQLLAKMQRKPK
jgi:hypothetical protein